MVAETYGWWGKVKEAHSLWLQTAAELGFAHPTTGERLSFTSPLPEDLRDVLASLE